MFLRYLLMKLKSPSQYSIDNTTLQSKRTFIKCSYRCKHSSYFILITFTRLIWQTCGIINQIRAVVLQPLASLVSCQIPYLVTISFRISFLILQSMNWKVSPVFVVGSSPAVIRHACSFVAIKEFILTCEICCGTVCNKFIFRASRYNRSFRKTSM